MKRSFIVFLAIFSFSVMLKAQVFWTEDFGTGCSQGQLASAYTGPNGTWTITNTGTNDAYADQWFVSAMEAGMGAGNCGDGCGNNPALTNRTLHAGNEAIMMFGIPADMGAAYNAGGPLLCGSGICTTTDRRAESPVINCSGKSNITLSFEYIEFGDGTNDNATLWYFDGTTWTQLADLNKTSCCDGSGNTGVCDGATYVQGYWTTFTISLPASANNNPNVRIGFRWVNNNDGVGTDPSFAVDNIQLSTPSANPLTAIISASQTTICAGQCISFSDASTGSPTSWTWTFNGGTPASSTLQNPGNVCFNAPGSYNVTLLISNGINTDDTTIVVTVNNCSSGPVANFSASATTICASTCINFTDLSTGNPTSWNWQFPGGTPSSSSAQNPASVCYYTPGSYSVTLIVSDGTNSDTLTLSNYITVNDCRPTPNFQASANYICKDSCINFLDFSTGNPTSWLWQFPGAVPNTSTSQNPVGICYSDTGYHSVTLIASNQYGADTLTLDSFIYVSACRPPIANFSIPKKCFYNNCVKFQSTSYNQPTQWLWVFEGADPDTFTTPVADAPCWFNNITGTFTIKLYVANAFGVDSMIQTITIDTLPYVMAFNDTSIYAGASNPVYLYAVASESGGQYFWSPKEMVDCYYCPSVHTLPEDTTMYVVHYIDPRYCEAWDTVWVYVTKTYAVGVPSAFSPNGDGVNDVLYVKGYGIVSMNFKIYNRYGQKVFESSSQSYGWDGTFNGKPEDPGVFVWTLDAFTANNQRHVLKGNVTLIR